MSKYQNQKVNPNPNPNPDVNEPPKSEGQPETQNTKNENMTLMEKIKYKLDMFKVNHPKLVRRTKKAMKVVGIGSLCVGSFQMGVAVGERINHPETVAITSGETTEEKKEETEDKPETEVVWEE